MKITPLFFLLLLTLSCNGQNQVAEKESQEDIIFKHLKNGAWKYDMYSREWQEEIDKGLKKDPTIAYLWQQKAMPLFKQGKYELGMQYIDQAVKYDRQDWQPYRAFIKCIFAKTYQEAIEDFEDCKKRFGNSYEMDHCYNFYIALSKLQLNQFKEAERIFKEDIDFLIQEKGEGWVHHLDLFYYGISKFEQKKYAEAIAVFDQALEIYPEFSDVQYYKAKCLGRLGKGVEAEALFQLAKLNAETGFTINEDNALYERYPYQVRWF